MRDLARKPRNIFNPKRLFAAVAYRLDFTAQDHDQFILLAVRGRSQRLGELGARQFP